MVRQRGRENPKSEIRNKFKTSGGNDQTQMASTVCGLLLQPNGTQAKRARRQASGQPVACFVA